MDEVFKSVGNTDFNRVTVFSVNAGTVVITCITITVMFVKNILSELEVPQKENVVAREAFCARCCRIIALP